MSELSFRAVGGSLRRTDTNKLVSSSRGQLRAVVALNEDWQKVEPIVMQFVLNGGTPIDVRLENGECNVPWEALAESGALEVSLQGGDLITTNCVTLSVLYSGAVGGLVPTTASPSLYSELCTMYEDMKSTVGNIERVLSEVVTK
jgi:hypothetical protein